MLSATTKLALETWLADGDRAARQLTPGEELAVEHQVMEIVLAAMEAEVERMLTGQPLSPAFWRDVVDFNGNFVHLCHRVKEEEHLVTALVDQRLLDARQEESIRNEHVAGKEMTLALCEGIEEADWEKVLRLVSIYVHVMRPHMRREESGLFTLATKLPAAAVADVRHGFDAAERRAFGPRSRRHYVALAQRLQAPRA